MPKPCGPAIFEARREDYTLETESLSIAQASFLAGNTSTANFSTAFKRQSGFSPKEARTV